MPTIAWPSWLMRPAVNDIESSEEHSDQRNSRASASPPSLTSERVTENPSRRDDDAAGERLRHAGRCRKRQRQSFERAHREISEGLRLERICRPADIERGLDLGGREPVD